MRAKPIPDNFETTEDYIGALVDWRLDQRILEGTRCSQTSKPLSDNFETYEDFSEALVDWKIEQRLRDLTVAILGHRETHDSRSVKPLFDVTKGIFGPGLTRTREVLSKALFDQDDPTSWKEAQKILDDWSADGFSSVPHAVIDADGSLKMWLFCGVGDGIAGHLEDGSESFFWSIERGFQWWDQERIPAMI